MTQVRELLQGLSSPLRAVRDNLGEVAEAFVAAFAVEKIAHFVEEMGKLGEETLKTAHTLGMTVEEASSFRNTMEVLGLSADSAMRPLERLGAAMATAGTNGASQQAKAFQALGISMDEVKAHGDNAGEMLEVLRHSFQNLGDDMNKTNDFRILLGRGFDELIPYLSKTDEEIADLKARTAETGAALSGPMAKGMEETGENSHLLGQAFEGVGITLFEAFKPALDAVVEGLTYMVEGFNNALKSDSLLHDALTTLVLVVDGLVAATIVAGDVIAGVWAALRGIVASAIDVMETKIKVLWDALHLDWAAVDKDSKAGSEALAKDVSTNIDSIVDHAKHAVTELKSLFSNIGADGVDTSGGAAGSPGQGGPGKAGVVGPPGAAQQEGLMQQWKDALQQQQVDEQDFFKSSQANELLYWQSKLATVQQYEAQYGLTEKQAQQLHLQVQTEIYTLDKSQAQEWLSDYMAGLNEQLAALKDNLETKTISERQYFDQSVALEKDRQELLVRLGLQQTAAYSNSIKAIDALDKQHQIASEASWKSAANTISQSFDTMLRGILTGTQSWQQAMNRLIGNLVITWIESLAKMGVQWAAHQAFLLVTKLTTNTEMSAADLAMEAEHFGVVTSMTAADAAGDAAHKVSGLEAIMVDAKKAAAGAYASASEVPYIGWLLGPAAAAAAFAAVAAFGSFAVGAWELPSDMIAQVHKGEMIIPAATANMIRGGGTNGAVPFPSSALSGSIGGSQGSSPGGSSSSSSNGNTTVVFQISALDGTSVQNMLKSQGSTIASVIATAVRNGNQDLMNSKQAA